MFFLEALLPLLYMTNKHYLFIFSLAEGNNLARDGGNVLDFLKGRHIVDASSQFMLLIFYVCMCPLAPPALLDSLTNNK